MMLSMAWVYMLKGILLIWAPSNKGKRMERGFSWIVTRRRPAENVSRNCLRIKLSLILINLSHKSIILASSKIIFGLMVFIS